MIKAPSNYSGRIYSWGRRALEHHIVWWQHKGTIVPTGYDVRHKDNNGLNNKFSNLELMPHGKHTRYHQKKEPDLVLVCPYCGNSFTREARYVRSKTRLGQTQFYCSRAHTLRAQKPKIPVTHGTSSGYNTRGCRCDKCRAYKAKVAANSR